MIAAKVINGLTETLRELCRSEHRWREQANALIENLIDDLAHAPEMRGQGESVKQEILPNPVFAEQAGAAGRAGNGADRRSASPCRGYCRLVGDLRPCPRPMARRGPFASGEDQSAAQAPGAAHCPASPKRNRHLYRGGGRQLGHRDTRQPPGTVSRQGPATYPHQRDAGRRAGWALDLHAIARVWWIRTASL
jgi:hypothetical protein